MRSLSARLLVLTVFFVMLSEVFIFVPSVARFRMTYFDNHLAAAHLASLALAASPNGKLDQPMTNLILRDVGAHAVILHRPNGMVFMLDGPVVPQPDVTFDLTKGNVPIWIQRSLETLARNDNRIMRVVGPAPTEPGATVELLLDEAPLRHEMWRFGVRILELSVVISLTTATLVYLSLQWLLVRPMRRITESMTSFRQDPEDATRRIVPSGRRHEIGRAENELAMLQETVRRWLSGPASRRSAPPSQRSTTICAPSWRRRGSSAMGLPTAPRRRCAALRRASSKRSTEPLRCAPGHSTSRARGRRPSHRAASNYCR